MSIIVDTIISEGLNGQKVEKSTIKLDTAKRHVVRISDMTALKNFYKQNNTFRSRQLISTPVSSIAIFSNEYIPDHFPEDNYISYILTINGTDHPIVPINSARNGKKIIRTTANNTVSNSVDYISEKITSAYLTIIIKTPNTNETPYVSNIKVLIGGE